jgi:hypothetical protein
VQLNNLDRSDQTHIWVFDTAPFQSYQDSGKSIYIDRHMNTKTEKVYISGVSFFFQFVDQFLNLNLSLPDVHVHPHQNRHKKHHQSQQDNNYNDVEGIIVSIISHVHRITRLVAIPTRTLFWSLFITCLRCHAIALFLSNSAFLAICCLLAI